MVKDADAYDQVLRLISHDLRNPLTAVQLNAQLIERAAAQDGRAKEERWASLIASAARRIDKMIQQLVEAECIRSGRIQLVPQPVALDELLHELLAEANGGLERGRISMALPKQSVAISADRKRLGQALDSLLRLALQEAAAMVGVDVQVKASEVYCTIHAPRRSDADNTAPSDAPHRTEPGQGIALHLARTLIECHGGTLQCAEDCAHGLTFEVVLPTNRA